MRSISKFLLSASLLCMSQMALADCDDPDAPPDCITVTPDDSIDHSSGGGGFIYTSGGSSSGSQEGNSGSGGAGQTTTTTTPATDPPKTPRQKCLEEVAVNHSICKAKASADYALALSTTCAGLGTVTGGASGVVFSGSVSIDEFNQCDKVETAKRDNAIDVCNVFKDSQTKACP